MTAPASPAAPPSWKKPVCCAANPTPTTAAPLLLALTETGQQAVETTRQRLATLIETSLASWPPKEAQSFARQLHRFVATVPFAES